MKTDQLHTEVMRPSPEAGRPHPEGRRADLNAGRLVGALFLVALLSNGVGSELAEASSASRAVVLAGELLELVCGFAVIGIGVAVHARVRSALSSGYLAVRITEAAVNALIVVSTLAALDVAGPVRDALLAQRYQAQLVYIWVFAAGAVAWYVLLYRHRLVPRFVAVWGLGGLAVLLAGSLLDLFGSDLDMLVYGLPLGLNELFLGVWLLVRGFRSIGPPTTPPTLGERSPAAG